MINSLPNFKSFVDKLLQLCQAHKITTYKLVVNSFPNGDLVTRIVSSCPSLQHLALHGYWDPLNPIEISSASLRRLNIFVCKWNFLCQRTKFVLDVPNLEYLAYRDVSALHYSIGHMNAVVEAKVNIKDCLLETLVSLAWLLPNVRCLFIGGECVEPLHYCESKLKLPIFENLKHLELGCFGFCDWNRVLMELLNCAPLLETLSFPEGITDSDAWYDCFYVEVSERECNLWSSTETVPSCLVSHLKKTTAGCYMYTDWEQEMFKYFLRSSLVLEELDIYINRVVSKGAWIAEDRRLQKLPRASKTCSVRYHNVKIGTL